MTHRFIRSLAGVAVVTGLALTLACGGGDDDDNTSVINTAPTNVRISLPTTGVARHQYLLTANADSSSNITYEATSTTAGGTSVNLAKQDNRENLFLFVPQTAGLHRVTVTAKNADGAKSSADHHFVASENAIPYGQSSISISVAAGQSSSLSLSTTEPVDGDSVTWSREGAAFAGSFITAGGSATLTSNTLTITAGAATDNGSYTITGLRASESNNTLEGGIPSGSPITTNYTVNVTVGSGGGGTMEDLGPGMIEAELSNRMNAIRGVPRRIQFVGRPQNNTGVEYYATWTINDGSSTNTPPDAVTSNVAWISNPGDDVPPAKYRGGLITDAPLPVGTFLFLATDTTPYEQQIGVRAQFANGSVAYRSFVMITERNTPPTIVMGTLDNVDDNNANVTAGAATVAVGTAATRPWTGDASFSLTAGTRLPFKGSTPGSLDLVHDITISGLVIKDPDIKLSDNIRLTLAAVRGSKTGNTNLLSQLGGASAFDLKYSVIDDSTIQFSKILFTPPADNVTSTPAGSELIAQADQDLTLYYKVTDLPGANATKNAAEGWGNDGVAHPTTVADNGSVFTITIPVRPNPAPIIDGYEGPVEETGWRSSSADMPKDMGGWVSGQPIINIPIEWTIPNRNSADPSHYEVTDAYGSRVALLLDDKTATGKLGISLAPTGTLAATASNWVLKWVPPASYARQPYSYTLGAFNQWGAKAEDVTVNGIVWGPITGKPVSKKLYGTAGEWSATGVSAPTGPILTSPADFSRWTSISFNPFFPTSNRAYGNRYGKTLKNMSWTYEYDTESGNTAAWRVRGVPDGFYLISAGEVSNVGATTGPVVGPAVTGDYTVFTPGDGAPASASGHASTVSGVNVGGYAFAYTNSNSVDLTTHAPFGVLAGLVDTSISYDLINSSSDDQVGWAANIDAQDRVAVNAIKAYFGNLNLFFSGRPGFEPINNFGEAEWADLANAGVPIPAAGSSVQGGDVYEGNFSYILAGMLRDRGAIQFAFRDTNQKGFFKSIANENAEAGSDYPVGVYPPGLGWTAYQGIALQAFVNAAGDAGHSYTPIRVPLSDVTYDDPATPTFTDSTANGTGPLPWQVKANDRMNVLGMQKIAASGLTGISPANLSGNFWKAISTGTSDSPAIGGYDTATASPSADLEFTATKQSIAFEQTTDEGVLSATIDRNAFLAALTYGGNNTSTGGTAVRGAFANNASILNDTLQVINYSNGTELGPVDNNNAVPTLLEFGNLRTFTGTGLSTTAATPGNITFNAPVPKPNPSYWSGQYKPVVHYRLNYNNTAGNTSFIPGSMGVMTTNLTQNITPQLPIQNLRITTTGRYHALNAPNVLAASSNLTMGPVASVSPSGVVTYTTTAATGVAAQAYDNDDNGFRAVWLTWTNPAGDFSGNIIEFFNANVTEPVAGGTPTPAVTLADADAGNAQPPLYRVYVGPNVTEFPIPQEWIEYGALKHGGTAPVGTLPGTPGTGLEHVIVRVRTVSYGSAAEGNLVNFNETPFIQAFPYKWTDTVSCKVDFRGVTFPSNPAMLWKTATPSLRLTPSAVVGVFGNWTSDVQTVTADGINPAGFAWSLPGTEVNSSNLGNLQEGASLTAAPGGTTWAIESINITGGTATKDDVTLSGTTTSPTALPTLTFDNDTTPGAWNGTTSVRVNLVMTAKDSKEGIENKLSVPVTVTPPAIGATVSPATALTLPLAGVINVTTNEITVTGLAATTFGTTWTSGTGNLTGAYNGPSSGNATNTWAWTVAGTTHGAAPGTAAPAQATVTGGSGTGLDVGVPTTITLPRATLTDWASITGPITVTLRLTVTFNGQTGTADVPVSITMPAGGWDASS